MCVRTATPDSGQTRVRLPSEVLFPFGDKWKYVVADRARIALEFMAVADLVANGSFALLLYLELHSTTVFHWRSYVYIPKRTTNTITFNSWYMT